MAVHVEDVAAAGEMVELTRIRGVARDPVGHDRNLALGLGTGSRVVDIGDLEPLDAFTQAIERHGVIGDIVIEFGEVCGGCRGQLGDNVCHRPCEPGEPGYLTTQGSNIMSRYVGDPEGTEAVFREGWYTGLRDIAFALENNKDGQLDYYWMSRDSALLIRGGANYAYDQIAAELSEILVEDFQLKPEHFKLAVVGLRLESEHEDSCCVTIELSKEVKDIESQLQAHFIATASPKVSKGARPDYIRFAPIPLNFKGTVLYPQLKQESWNALRHSK